MSKNSSISRIQFNICAQFNSIWPLDCTISGSTTLSQSGPGSDVNEGVLRIPQSSTSPSDFWCHIQDTSTEKQSLYSTAPADEKIISKWLIMITTYFIVHLYLFFESHFFSFVSSWTAIDRLSIIWKSDLTDKMKRSFFQAAVVSILLYGCTTETLT